MSSNTKLDLYQPENSDGNYVGQNHVLHLTFGKSTCPDSRLSSPYINKATVLGDGRICVSGYESCAIFKGPREVRVDLRWFADKICKETGVALRASQRRPSNSNNTPVRRTSTPLPSPKGPKPSLKRDRERNNEVAEPLQKNQRYVMHHGQLPTGPVRERDYGKTGTHRKGLVPTPTPRPLPIGPNRPLQRDEVAEAQRKNLAASPTPGSLPTGPNRSLKRELDNGVSGAHWKNLAPFPTHRPLPVGPNRSLKPERDKEVAGAHRKNLAPSASPRSLPPGSNRSLKREKGELDNGVTGAHRTNPAHSPTLRPLRSQNAIPVAPNTKPRPTPEKRGAPGEASGSLKRPHAVAGRAGELRTNESQLQGGRTKGGQYREKTSLQSSTTEDSGMDLIGQAEHLAPLQDRVSQESGGTVKTRSGKDC